jgi:addiction module HigA family antidote
MADFDPTHPGEILMTEFLGPLGSTQYRIAKAIDVPPRRINEIVHGKRAISADTAQRHVLHQHAGSVRRRSRSGQAGERTRHDRTHRLNNGIARRR